MSWYTKFSSQEKVHVFVYGTLKKGNEADHELNNDYFVSKATLPASQGFLLVDVDNQDWPAIVPSKEKHLSKNIEGELYFLPKSEVKSLIKYEKVPEIYKFKQVKIIAKNKEIIAFAFIMNILPESQEIVETGNWED